MAVKGVLPAAGIKVYNSIFDDAKVIISDLKTNHGIELPSLSNFSIKDGIDIRDITYQNLEELIDIYQRALQIKAYAEELDAKYDKLIELLAALIMILNWLFVKVVVNPYSKEQMQQKSERIKPETQDYNETVIGKFLMLLRKHRLVTYQINESDIKDSKIVLDMKNICNFIEDAAKQLADLNK